MMMVDLSRTHHPMDDIDLLEIQRRLLADQEFLRSLHLADMLEDEGVSSQSSVDSAQVPHFPVGQGILKRKLTTPMECAVISSESE